MIPLAVGVVASLLTLSPATKIGIAAWCTVDKNTGNVQCNYETRGECEGYRESTEYCVKNPEPGKKY